MSKIVKFSGRRQPVVKRTLSSGGYEADFYADTDAGIYHYIVTKKNSADILAWGQEASAAEAERAAIDWMHDLYERALGASAAG